MMVDQIGAQTPSYTTYSGSEEASSLGKQDFLQLLVTQLRNQDPLDPLKNEDFIAQLAQFNSLEELINLNQTTESVGTLQILTSSSSLLGKTVEAVKDDQIVEGEVKEVGFYDGDVILALDTEGTTVEISVKDIVTVR
ncbi:MAG: flagellar hook capping protein [Candidatus Omnitrophica bacterium]|nr:flagellar hook capping protein [Candidatus Omnitrophota bacterium]MBD3269138.1 flagellar hook capping protein [Candidatus Omnitrophota bacterium]